MWCRIKANTHTCVQFVTLQFPNFRPDVPDQITFFLCFDRHPLPAQSAERREMGFTCGALALCLVSSIAQAAVVRETLVVEEWCVVSQLRARICNEFEEGRKSERGWRERDAPL